MAERTRWAIFALEVWAQWVATADEGLGWPGITPEARAALGHTGSQTPGPRIPRIDHARLGPWVHRLLIDMVSDGHTLTAAVLRTEALLGGYRLDYRASVAGTSRRTYTRRRRAGMNELEKRMQRLRLDNEAR